MSENQTVRTIRVQRVDSAPEVRHIRVQRVESRDDLLRRFHGLQDDLAKAKESVYRAKSHEAYVARQMVKAQQVLAEQRDAYHAAFMTAAHDALPLDVYQRIGEAARDAMKVPSE